MSDPELIKEFEDRYRKEKLYAEFVKYKEAQEAKEHVNQWRERKCPDRSCDLEKEIQKMQKELK